jgi:stage III sporulation protein SpoIIIAA
MVKNLGEFGTDNRAGITGTLHRISAIRNRRGVVIGLTCRIGRAVSGHTTMLRKLLEGGWGGQRTFLSGTPYQEI